ncbi:MAG TPA: HEPN domain-containing protein [Gemmatimonadaceae bacterium]|nr:HEPN domain-containing protein [Gemmatimonadaceae bacterium]
MIQAVKQPGELVDEIVTTLITRFQPRRIYLFGSRARGDDRTDSDYDFLIEVEELPQGIRIHRGFILLYDFPRMEIQVHIRLPGVLERRKDDPGTVDWDVVREGKLLYALPGLATITPAADGGRVRERPGGPPRSVGGWLRAAEDDMRIAVHLSSDFDRFKTGICFHSQQAAEKFMKALIISRHRRPPRTHDLVELLDDLRNVGIELGGLEEDLRFLGPFAVDVRYPDDTKPGGISTSEIDRIARPYEATESEARRALATAERVEAAVRSHFQL